MNAVASAIVKMEYPSLKKFFDELKTRIYLIHLPQEEQCHIGITGL